MSSQALITTMGIEGVIDTGSSLVKPRDAMQLDLGSLSSYLTASMLNKGHASSSSTVSMSSPTHTTVSVSNLQQFSHGQSNPTYLLAVSTSGHADSRQLVLRKKPPGKILASAHAGKDRPS